MSQTIARHAAGRGWTASGGHTVVNAHAWNAAVRVRHPCCALWTEVGAARRTAVDALYVWRQVSVTYRTRGSGRTRDMHQQDDTPTGMLERRRRQHHRCST
eukprot:7121179-Alexandrium_andersonii.AAC.1